MSSRRLAFLVLPAAALVASCSTTAAPTAAPSQAPRGAVGGDALLAAGDFDAAAAAYQRDLDGGSDSAIVREKLANAKWRAAMVHAAAALRAADQGDVARAQTEMARADSFGPDVPAVREMHLVLDARLGRARQSAALRDQARVLLVSDPAEAERLLGEAQAVLAGGMPASGTEAATDAASLRREASLRAEANRSAERAVIAWAARDRARTARELSASQFAGRPVPRAEELRRVIEQDIVAESSKAGEAELREAAEFADATLLSAAVVRVLKDRLADKLLAAAQDLQATQRPAVAALLELEARRLRSDAKTPALDQVRERTTLTMIIHPLDDETGGKVDGLRLARALRERLALDAMGGGLPLRALDDSESARAAYPDAVHVTGRVLSARTTEGRVGRDVRKIPFQTGTERRLNPEFTSLMTRNEAAVVAQRTAEEAERVAVATLESLKALSFQKGADGRPRLGDVTHRSQVAAAEVRLAETQRETARAKDAAFTLRQAITATPRDIDAPVMGEHVLYVTTMHKTSQLTARLDLAAGTDLRMTEDVSAEATHRETVSDGFAPAAVAADPDDTPDDATMAARVADRFATMAAGRLRADAQSAAARFLVAARAAERAGRRDEAAEGYALYLLATPDVLAPERADAARALEELLGIRVALRTTSRKEQP